MLLFTTRLKIDCIIHDDEAIQTITLVIIISSSYIGNFGNLLNDNVSVGVCLISTKEQDRRVENWPRKVGLTALNPPN